MQNPQKDNVKQRPPIQPSEDGIISLLDAPELDEGVVAEAAFYGADGIAELLAAVESKSKLHPERKAAALFLLGRLKSDGLKPLISKIIRSGDLGVQVSLIYAMIHIDQSFAEKQFLPILEKEDLDISFLREHTAHALWIEGDEGLRQSISRAIEKSSDVRLKTALLSLLASENFHTSEDTQQ